MNVNDSSDRLIRWRLQPSGYDFELKYKKGRANTQADASYRIDTNGGTVLDVDAEIPCFSA